MLEALANELPRGTIRYLSKVVAIEESGFYKIVHLADGTTIKTKVSSMRNKHGYFMYKKQTTIMNPSQ